MNANKFFAGLRIRLHQIAFLGTAVFVMLSGSRWNDGAFEIIGALLVFAGLCLVAVAMLGRLWCMLYIGGRKTDMLVTDGPYSLSRNPLYFFSLLGAVGIGLCTKTLTVPILLFVCVYPIYGATIRAEEANLAAVHAGAYARYRCAVPRFFPMLSGFKEPGKKLVNLKVYRSHIVHAFWFIVVAAAMELRVWEARLLLW